MDPPRAARAIANAAGFAGALNLQLNPTWGKVSRNAPRPCARAKKCVSGKHD